ncbi:hypothetical protein OIU84_003473 [Salix udensis]|uniref:Myb/SANT-like DNA-binding domain-containing protein n=1 Tax=Salix udensis TaxID=889485 RepID=A0AAD6P374_9ROSI|nr:hypothetical protein OIU84_003473 [Salix udensis]
MDKEVNRESPSLLPNNNTTIKEESPRKLFGGAGVVTGGGGDRLKRDEWSEGAVSTLLEAYENKWILRNRAKLKGNDWEDVAHHVSSRANSTKSPKTQTQCKNKIESMKKSAAAAVTPPPQVLPQHQQPSIPTSANPPLMLLMDRSPLAVTQPPAPPMAPPHPPPPPPPHHHQTIRAAQNSHGSNGVDKGAKGDGMDAKLSDHVSDKNSMDTDSSTPAALYSDDKEEPRSKKLKKKTEKRKRRKREEWEMADSIRWLAEVVVRSEQARMETMRELEKMRIEAEAKRGEMDLKRTEIIATTQLEIAKLFAGAGRAVDSSLRIGKT